MKKVALLLDHEASLYEQLLAREAMAGAQAGDIELLKPAFAEGSSFTQLEQLLGCTKGDRRCDAVLIVTAGQQSHLTGARLVVKAGISMIFVNRVPDYLAELRAVQPDVLVTSAAPDQEAVGQIQALQCRKLLPRGGYVLLVQGTVGSSAVIGRTKGLRDNLGAGYDLHPLEGEWSEPGAFKAVIDGFRLGLERSREVAAVVCQNDAMAKGARRALLDVAERKGTNPHVPILGCDGQVSEGLAMVRRGELAATVVMPATTRAALQMLKRYWQNGEHPQSALLQPESYPGLDQLSAA